MSLWATRSTPITIAPRKFASMSQIEVERYFWFALAWAGDGQLTMNISHGSFAERPEDTHAFQFEWRQIEN